VAVAEKTAVIRKEVKLYDRDLCNLLNSMSEDGYDDND
jgi:hypothetical protein